MCKECENNHRIGYRCSCECHQPIDRIIAERDIRNSEEVSK